MSTPLEIGQRIAYKLNGQFMSGDVIKTHKKHTDWYMVRFDVDNAVLWVLASASNQGDVWHSLPGEDVEILCNMAIYARAVDDIIEKKQEQKHEEDQEHEDKKLRARQPSSGYWGVLKNHHRWKAELACFPKRHEPP